TVSLLDTAQGTLCTASILSEDVVITAAHCVSGHPNNMELSFGPRSAGHDLRRVVDVAVAAPWARHSREAYDNGDIALVKFAGGLPPGFKPATLMKSSQRLSDGQTVTLAGFGTSSGEGTGAGRLRLVDVKIAKADYSKTEVAVDQTKGHGACHGDSGGPAFVQDGKKDLLLWGVTSRGIDDPHDHCAGEAVYTRIQPYAPWIDKVVQAWRK
ncbi:MAG TPA: trypsin-like serine protease, partial [Bdellovibrio sp.]|nr:trypsin-like serine protease [Bdellovibrio sp.]